MNRYRNLDIDLLDYQRRDEGESLRARVISSPVGEQRDSDALSVSFPSRLRDRIVRLEKRFKMEIDVKDDPNLRREEFVVRSSRRGEELTHLMQP